MLHVYQNLIKTQIKSRFKLSKILLKGKFYKLSNLDRHSWLKKAYTELKKQCHLFKITSKLKKLSIT